MNDKQIIALIIFAAIMYGVGTVGASILGYLNCQAPRICPLSEEQRYLSCFSWCLLSGQLILI